MAPRLARLELPVNDGLREAIDRFDCVGGEHLTDPVAHEVNDFLRQGGYEQGIEQGFSTTYLLVDDEPSEPSEVIGHTSGGIIGYTTVAVDSLRLSDGEKKALDRPDFGDFGAIRIVMIGVDHRHAGHGHGELLLGAIADLAQSVGRFIAVRFLTADANVRKQEWYERRGFVVNRAKREQERSGDPPTTISMRLDLLADVAAG